MVTILTQDKKNIVECGTIMVCPRTETDKWSVVYSQNSKEHLTLGTYPTEERAKEVLAQIYEIMWNFNEYENPAKVFAMFKMPESRKENNVKEPLSENEFMEILSSKYKGTIYRVPHPPGYPNSAFYYTHEQFYDKNNQENIGIYTNETTYSLEPA